MSLILAASATKGLRQAILEAPVGLCTALATKPRVLLAQFDWVNDYAASTANPTTNVLVNIRPTNLAPLDLVRSVKIDNLGNSFPVYVYFPDTTDTIVAPPNSLVWEPVVSNTPLANVVMKGAQTGLIGRTNVYFCNFFVPPYVNSEQPQLGVQSAFTDTLILTNNSSNNILTTPRTSGYFYLTNIFISVTGLNTNGVTSHDTRLVWSGVRYGTLFDWRIVAPKADVGDSNGLNFIVYEAQAANLRLDATDTWSWRNTFGLGSGNAFANMSLLYRTID